MTALRELTSVTVRGQVRVAAKRRAAPTPAPMPTMPKPEITSEDLKRMPKVLRDAALAACKGDLYRLSWGEDGSIEVG